MDAPLVNAVAGRAPRTRRPATGRSLRSLAPSVARPAVHAARLGAILAAALTVLLPWGMIYDAWSWSLWARDLAGGVLDTSGQTAWKPLPPLVASVPALIGISPAVAWLAVERACALVAVLLAYRLASRFAGAIAGVCAVVGLLLTAGWIRYAAEGYSEPVLVALLLGGASLHAARRDAWALACLLGAALVRPEAWPLLLASSAWLWWRAPRRRWLVVAAWLLVGALWLGGEWIGSGSPLAGARRALESPLAQRTAAADHPLLTVLGRGLGEPLAVVWPLAAFGAWTAWRRREWALLATAGAVVLWFATVAGMQLLGYPGIARFLLPAAALACVVAAVGAVRVIALGVRGGRPTTALTRAALSLALLAVTVPFAVARVGGTATDVARVGDRAALQTDLQRAVDRGLAPATPCVNEAFRTALAYAAGAPAPATCRPPVRCTVAALRAPPTVVTGPRPPVRGREIAQVGGWRVLGCA